MYNYEARVLSVYDGDTYTLEIDLGLSIRIIEKCRLLGVDTPEVSLRGDTTKQEKEKGLMVRDKVREWIEGKTVEITTHKDKKGKYGRYLVNVTLPDNSTLPKDLAARLLELKYAVPLNY